MDQRIIAHKFCPIIREDDHYLFVGKPAGLASRAGTKSRSASVLDLLKDRDDAASLVPLYDVNRWQSGVLAYAKSEAAARHLLTGLETGSAKPVYIAVVQGKLKPGSQTVTGAIKQVDQDRFAVDRRALGKELPTTKFDPMDRGETRAVVRCSPNVLNHHQVRAHLQSINLRIVGDATYAERGDRPQPDSARGGSARKGPGPALPMMLHLAELRFHHPAMKRAITVRAKVPPEFADALDRDCAGRPLEGLLAARLRAALAMRLPCLIDEGTSAFRLLNGRADGVPGLVVELYGDVLILQIHQGKFDAGKMPLRAIADWYRGQLGATAAYVKQFAKDRSRIPQKVSGRVSAKRPKGDLKKDALTPLAALSDPHPLVGKAAPDVFAVRENGLRFLVRPYDGYAVGLFLDHRENRRRVRELSAGGNVLNLFCYTCGFSVAAAAGGAKATVNVDIARKCLEWGKENFKANGLALDDHIFINDDAFNYFKRARRQQRKFDVVVLDPPSFARSKKNRRVFTLEKDLQQLVAGAISLLVPSGVMLVSTNHRGTSRKWLREQIALAAGLQTVSVISTPRLPVDFAGDPDHAKTVIVRIT